MATPCVEYWRGPPEGATTGEYVARLSLIDASMCLLHGLRRKFPIGMVDARHVAQRVAARLRPFG
jgi:hypothetical protein